MSKVDKIEVARNILYNAAKMNMNKENILKISQKIDRYKVEHFNKGGYLAKMPWGKGKISRFVTSILLMTGFIFSLLLYLLEGSNSSMWKIYLIFQFITTTVYLVFLQKLQRQVYLDALTGLNNRRYFYERLSRLKTKNSFSLLLIDIDDFKRINDTYGHAAGDLVLQQVAKTLQSVTRKNDLIARWGGDEFVIVLLEVNEQEAFKVACRLKNLVENSKILIGDSFDKVTISIGIASIKKGTSFNVEYFMKVADEALYKAKGKKNFITIGG
ncbi:GGDEF domain-containing protein [Carboxydothermus pertinax]|uniref:GGDEF domain-containing protein n=1 Tax=Carboxydothermus pertinax TaxID=870242 RepID=A0A1L8CSI5_9THEO|nr:GGDEF domain-containing protein [Carboxydothermus pertinax]GAV21881.1 GGDEF domain-containing protein [Carboxydothermus pertinax]